MRVSALSSPKGTILQTRSIIALAGLILAACGSQPEPAANPAAQTRIFDTQRDALEKAKAVSETAKQGDQALRAQEEAQAK
jgi:uncharacterized protein YcfL